MDRKIFLTHDKFLRPQFVSGSSPILRMAWLPTRCLARRAHPAHPVMPSEVLSHESTMIGSGNAYWMPAFLVRRLSRETWVVRRFSSARRSCARPRR